MWLGVSLSLLEDPDNSFLAYEKAIQLDPSNPLYRLNFAITLNMYDVNDRAREHLKAYFDLMSPSSSDKKFKESDVDMVENAVTLRQILCI